MRASSPLFKERAGSIMDSQFIKEVREAVRHSPRLTPLFTSTHNIPERLYEYNPRLFLCFNNVENSFEIHSLDQEFTLCAKLPYPTLDARAIRYIWENDIRVHGKAIFQRIEDGEERHRKQKEREYKNWVEAVGKETQSLFAKDAWA